MRAIIILAIVVLLMGLAGWLTFGHSPGKTSINIETEQIQEDTQNALDRTESAIDSGVEAFNNE